MPDLDPDPCTATDPEWWAGTGMCGGCGTDTCHDGPCQTDPCTASDTRWAEGWFCRPGCQHTQEARHG